MIRFSVVSTEIFRGASIPIPPKLFAAASGQVDRRTYSAPRKKSTGEDADKQNGDTLRYTFFSVTTSHALHGSYVLSVKQKFPFKDSKVERSCSHPSEQKGLVDDSDVG